MEKIKKNDKNPAKKKYAGEKLLTIPGISEAIDLVEGHAWVCAVNEAIDAAGDGQFGEKIKRVLDDSPAEGLDMMLKEQKINDYITAQYKDWLEKLAVVTSPKIKELWTLSESACQRLSVSIYLGDHKLTLKEETFSPLVLLVNVAGNKEKEILERHKKEFEKKDCIFISDKKMQKGHVYLDVTELSYSRFRASYRLIELCRKYLDIKKKDLQVGAPSSINTEKAFEVAYLSTRQPLKKFAKRLGFKIYSNDNPSGSYPLLRKYLKIGKELEARLKELDGFIISYIKK